jgi:hypothetical protein
VGAYEYGTFMDPTLIELVSFAAVVEADGVLVEWQTASEVECSGFNLVRTVGGDTVQLNATLIPGRGGPTQGASYAYRDVDVTPGTVYSYMLEDVDVRGRANRHGPVVVGVGNAPTSVGVLGLSTGGASIILPLLVLGAGALASAAAALARGWQPSR